MSIALPDSRRAHPLALRGSLAPVARRVLAAAALVGVLDALYVVVVFSLAMRVATPTRISQGVARALLGRSAFAGGGATAALGLAMHFGVALGWTVVWAAAYRASARLRVGVRDPRAAAAIGAAYGLLVWLAMNLMILPLTLAPPPPFGTPTSYLVLASHLLVIGPPIVLLVRDADGYGH